MNSEAALLEADLDARKRAIDTGRSIIVQAPAGSGKTELLIQRYLELLAIVDDPEEVLAITFTLKAAAEMRNRVLEALQRAVDQGLPEPPHERITHDAALRVLRRSHERDWRLIESPRRMRIMTLDAFSAGIARMLPVSSGLGLPAAIVVEEEMKSLHQSAAAATLDWLDSRDERKGHIERVLRHLDNNTSLYVSQVARMLAARDQWLPIIGGGDPGTANAAAARAQMEASLRALVEDQLDRLRRNIPREKIESLMSVVRFAAGNLAEGENPRHPLARFAGAHEFPDFDADQLGKWQSIVSLLLTKEGGWRRQIETYKQLHEMNGVDVVLGMTLS